MNARALEASGLVLVGLLAVSGCDMPVQGELDVGDAERVVESAEPEPRADLAYWRAVRLADSAQWKAAVERCRTRRADRYPNCLEVNRIRFLGLTNPPQEYKADWRFAPPGGYEAAMSRDTAP